MISQRRMLNILFFFIVLYAVLNYDAFLRVWKRANCGESIQHETTRSLTENSTSQTPSRDVTEQRTSTGSERGQLSGRCEGCNHWEYEEIILPAKDFCTRDRNMIDLFIIVLSKAENRRNREIQRTVLMPDLKTKKRVQTVFGFGKFKNETENQLLQDESAKFGDILQFGLIDAYTNSTIIVLNTAKWVLNNCKNTKFIVKITDDVYLNVGVLLELFAAHPTLYEDVVFGLCWYDAAPNKNIYKAKYTMPSEAYPFSKFPSYCAGAGYFTSYKLMSLLLKQASNIAVRTIHDDVSFGMLAKLAGKCVCNTKGFELLNAWRFNKDNRILRIGRGKKIRCSKIAKRQPVLAMHLDGLKPENLLRVSECGSQFLVPVHTNNACLKTKKCRKDNNFPIF